MEITLALYHCLASHLHQHLSRATASWKSESLLGLGDIRAEDNLIILYHLASCGEIELNVYVLKMSLAVHHTGKKTRLKNIAVHHIGVFLPAFKTI